MVVAERALEQLADVGGEAHLHLRAAALRAVAASDDLGIRDEQGSRRSAPPTRATVADPGGTSPAMPTPSADSKCERSE